MGNTLIERLEAWPTDGLADLAIGQLVLEAASALREFVDILVELDDLRSGCADDELGAIAGKRIADFVVRYRAAISLTRKIEDELLQSPPSSRKEGGRDEG